MTKGRFISRLRAVLTEIGVPHDQYSGHGAATSAALAGVEDSMIHTLGRWQSAAFLRYVRTPPEELEAISVTLGSENHHLAARQTDDRGSYQVSVDELLSGYLYSVSSL